MKSCKEISALWGISERRVTQFCKDGKIPGAVRAGKQWQIPDDAKRPSDSRIVTGQYVKTETEEGKSHFLLEYRIISVPSLNTIMLIRLY